MRVLIFGNSGSGKSHLASRLGLRHGCPVLDLDTVVWAQAAVFRADAEIIEALERYVATNPSWIIEGCYGRWMEHLAGRATELIFMNPGEEVCVRHCQARPWEPHKYASREAQDAVLPFLLEWVRGYYSRSDDMSLAAHRRIFEAFPGPKRELKTNEPESPASAGQPR